MFARKGRTLDEAIALTDKLLQSSLHLQNPLDESLNEAFRSSDLLAGTITSDNLGALRQQEARLKVFAVETAKASPAIAALAKQRLLLALYRSHLVSWRASIANRYKDARKDLLIRVSILAVVIACLIGAAAASRRVTARHIRDSNSRRMILIALQVLFWLILVLIVLFAFEFNLTSLATFLGLVSAGIAVALQNVILSVAGYFLLIGKVRMRIGDRVQISGVTGEVVDIGLMQFQLQELDTSSEQPTGRIVSFSNSFVFVSPATGLFEGIRRSAKTSG
jgi:small-conductance mechanosensitive channel